MATSIKVSSAGLQSGIEELTQLNANFKTQISNLVETESALNSMWEGEARTAFHTAFTSDKGQMDTFYNEILKYITALQSILKLYEQMESRNVATATARTYK